MVLAPAGICPPAGTVAPSQGPTPREAWRGGEGALLLLGVELDDQLLLDRGVDDLPGRDAVDQDAQLAADDLQPRRHRTLAGAGLGDLERHHAARLLSHLDDVVGAHAVRRDVDLAAVHPDVAVA